MDLDFLDLESILKDKPDYTTTMMSRETMMLSAGSCSLCKSRSSSRDCSLGACLLRSPNQWLSSGRKACSVGDSAASVWSPTLWTPGYVKSEGSSVLGQKSISMYLGYRGAW